MLSVNCLMVTIAYIFIWSSNLFGYCIILSWTASWWCINFWVNWFYHLLLGSLLSSQPFKDPCDLLDDYFFNHFDWLVFIRILFYDAYHVIPHPPMKFQADTPSFGLILEVVTFKLPLVFHPVFYYSKPHGLIPRGFPPLVS